MFDCIADDPSMEQSVSSEIADSIQECAQSPQHVSTSLKQSFLWQQFIATSSWARSFSMWGWPEMILDALSPLWWRWSELMVEGDSVLWGVHVVVQTATAGLEELHWSHPDCCEDEGPSLQLCVVARIRQRGWRRTCLSYQAVKHTPAKAPLHPWAWPTSPWECIHVDFAGPVAGRMLSWCMVVRHMLGLAKKWQPH